MRWFALDEGAEEACSEPWMAEHIYKKLNEKAISGEPGYGPEQISGKIRGKKAYENSVGGPDQKLSPAGEETAAGVTAVKDFNFEIPDGELIGLLGPSGCGKSTTLNMICGLEKPTCRPDPFRG